jgi:cytoplasmic iron level regulating protein YaaA (DUF328/UPF0246 family)
MLTVISPAKKLDMSQVDQLRTEPDLQKDASLLARTAKKLTVADLQKLMHISENLAELNANRFKAFKPSPSDDMVKQAAFMFAGDTYTGLDVQSFDDDALRYAQTHLRILSGLYGLLRPLDAIQPYRLEMGSRLQTTRGKSLYEFWGKKISRALNAQADAEGTDVLLNCASQEYFGAVDQKSLKLKIITPTFLEDKTGGPKIVSFFAKQARGAMARFVMQNRIKAVEGLQDFDLGGYKYQPTQSSDIAPVFLREDTTVLKKAS